MNNQYFKAFVIREDSDKTISRSIETKIVNDLPAGDVLIKVHYSALNYKDALSANGHHGITRNYPHVPGVDAAGIVAESRSDKFKPGDEVLVTGYDLGMNTWGGFSEYIRVPGEWVVPIPKGLDLKESMIFGTAGFTVGLCIYEFERRGLNIDSGKILVTGATGGVGSLAVAMLSKAGYYVSASTGKPDKAEYLKSLGAQEILSREDVVDNSNKTLLSKKWAAVIDNVGGSTLSTAVRTTAPWGTVASVGLVSSDQLSISVYPFLLRGVAIVGIDSADRPMDQRLMIWDRIANDWKFDNPVSISKLITLDELNNEIELILNGKLFGRTVIALI